MRLKAETVRKTIPMSLPFALRMKAMSLFCGHVDDVINKRAEHKARVLHCTDSSGNVGLIIDSTDCDHCRSVYSRIVPASQVDAEIARIYDSAEGRTFVQIVKPVTLAGFIGSSRDLALEAFEDGHPHCIGF